MISAWHLLWIIPVSAMIGIIMIGILAANGDDYYN